MPLTLLPAPRIQKAIYTSDFPLHRKCIEEYGLLRVKATQKQLIKLIKTIQIQSLASKSIHLPIYQN